MNHQQYREWLPLLLYNELQEQEKNQLREHLKQCSSCADELKQIEKLHSIVGDQPFVKPSETLVQEARQELRVALRKQRSRKSWAEGILEGLQGWRDVGGFNDRKGSQAVGCKAVSHEENGLEMDDHAACATTTAHD